MANGTVTFNFMGICTHFTVFRPQVFPAGVQHRVVLVNASNITQPIAAQLIPPHYASMAIPQTPATSAATIGLTGFSVTVQNPADIPIAHNPNFNEVPNLTDLMSQAGSVIGPPSPAVLHGYNSALTAAYFDFGNGANINACSNMGAVATSVTVTTSESDTDPVVILMTPFPNAPWPGSSPQTISVPSGTTIVVQNVSYSETNATYHFYLNYLTAENVPANPQLPPADSLPSCGTQQVAGPGCSNTNYP